MAPAQSGAMFFIYWPGAKSGRITGERWFGGAKIGTGKHMAADVQPGALL